MSDFLSTAESEEAPAEERASRAAAPPIRATDGERLMRFWRHRDEAAFAEVVQLHAGLVWGVCSQVLRRREDVEDAFQATFLILARKAKTIRAADSAAGWLYRVAFRTALLARSRRSRLMEESLIAEPAADGDPFELIARHEQCQVLLEELNSLPMQYRQPLVLCYLEGRTRNEAAAELGVTPQSVKGRLARGTRLLRTRMVSRGAALSTSMAAMTAALVATKAGATPILITHTATLGAGFALKLIGAGATATAAKGAATLLAEKGMLSMTIAAAAKPAVGVLGVVLTAGMLAVATAEPPQAGEGGAGAAPVVLLADAGAGDGELVQDVAGETNASNEDEPNDVVISPQTDATKGAQASTGSTSSSLDDPFAARADIVAAAAVGVSDQSPWQLVPAQQSPNIEVRLNPFAISNSVATTVPTGGGGGGFVRTSEVAQREPFQFANAPVLTHGAGSQATLELESQYWDIKSKALKKKAESLQMEAKRGVDVGLPPGELLGLEAEAGLTLAEVKLCEVNAQRIKESLEAAETGKLKMGDKGVRVLTLQAALNAATNPSPKLDVDGDFGVKTQEAVMQIQKMHGLKADGIVDERTAQAVGMSGWGGAPSTPHIAEPLFSASETYARAQQVQAQAQQAAKAAVAAAAQSAKAAAKAAAQPIPSTATIVIGEELSPDESARAFNREIGRLQRANAELQRKLEELEDAHATSRN